MVMYRMREEKTTMRIIVFATFIRPYPKTSADGQISVRKFWKNVEIFGGHFWQKKEIFGGNFWWKFFVEIFRLA